MLVGSKPRRVAVIGGVRIPFARAHGAYASVGNQQMLTAALQGRGGPLLAQGRAARRRRRRRGHEAFEPVEPGARVRCSTRASSPRRPASTCSAPAAPASRRRSSIANKIALGQIDSGIAGGVDTVSDPPIVYRRASTSSCCCACSAAAQLRRAHQAVPRPAAAALQAGLPGHRRAAHRPVDGPALRADGASTWKHHARGAGRARAREPPARRARPGRKDSCRTWSCPTSGSRPTTTCAPTPRLEKLAKLKPSFDARTGTLTAGNSHADDRRRRGGAARERGMGAGARPAGPGLADLRQDGGGRFRRRRGAADGARLRRAARCWPTPASRCRTSTSTRSTRPSRRRCCAR